MCDKVSPARVLEFLNTVFTRLDMLCDEHGVHKMETAGDCYVASAGVVQRINTTRLFEVKTSTRASIDEAPPVTIMDACLDAERVLSFGIAAMASIGRMRMPHDGTPVLVRMGIHSGPCVSGIVGTKLPKFAIFGDTINTASRMESTAPPGRIQVSSDTMQLIRRTGNAWSGSERNWEQLDGVSIKGKGVMRTFLWRSADHDRETPDAHKKNRRSRFRVSTLGAEMRETTKRRGGGLGRNTTRARVQYDAHAAACRGCRGPHSRVVLGVSAAFAAAADAQIRRRPPPSVEQFASPRAG